ncbi:aldo/keto reductase [Anaeromyxobacter sp. K]|uniref:aldo/keto reductase n=1 Tax=Anaeromyxobacter sp. (strain K) TaxID=447217 RepID=UPI00017BE2A1|nr:aldo/keto reductase [Anaeromyxobacter sp. K]ACG72984.1 aldo/keto reductase [Anaeromyxobacter sp. K]
MDTTRLGRTGLEVSRLCLGTMNFGPETPEDEAFRIMDRALDAGVFFFDTANVYGQKASEWGRLPREGRTEQIVGRWLAQGGGRRERIVLATKVYGPMWEGPNGRGLSAFHIRRACEDSLRRLGTDHVDLYQMHHVDRATPWDELWEAMDRLVRDGKVIYVGSSNFAGWHVAQACEAAARRNLLGLVSEQSLYNLASRTIELEVIPACRAYGVGILPWSPLAGGLLGGALAKAATGRRAGERVQKKIEQHRPQLERWEKLCAEMGQRPADVALAWVLGRPGVTAPIVGPRTVAQLDEAIAATELTLDPAALQAIDAIWPGPGGEAPEAYAW